MAETNVTLENQKATPTTGQVWTGPMDVLQALLPIYALEEHVDALPPETPLIAGNVFHMIASAAGQAEANIKQNLSTPDGKSPAAPTKDMGDVESGEEAKPWCKLPDLVFWEPIVDLYAASHALTTLADKFDDADSYGEANLLRLIGKQVSEIAGHLDDN